MLVSISVDFAIGLLGNVYLVDRHAAGIVLVAALGEDQFGGNVVATAWVRAGRGRGRWQVISLKVN
jgi:hypothetical protein